MSWITSLVDHSPIFPQSLFEWKEVFEYAASIAFSFLTGMLLGGVTFANRQRHRRAAKLSPKNVHAMMKLLQDYGATIVALGTTSISIYTGIKGIIGS